MQQTYRTPGRQVKGTRKSVGIMVDWSVLARARMAYAIVHGWMPKKVYFIDGNRHNFRIANNSHKAATTKEEKDNEDRMTSTQNSDPTDVGK
jgi:hypothetical protein